MYQALFRPDLVREKLTGDLNGKVKEATAKLDLGKVLASGSAPAIRCATRPQTILPRIVFISSNEKARRVWERTFPREQTLNESAVAASSSGASQIAMTSYWPSVQYMFLDSNATLLGHLLEGLRPADRFFDLADALIRETSKHNKLSHRNLPNAPHR